MEVKNMSEQEFKDFCITEVEKLHPNNISIFAFNVSRETFMDEPTLSITILVTVNSVIVYRYVFYTHSAFNLINRKCGIASFDRCGNYDYEF